ncbi:MAG: PAN domain-containing protein [Nitrospirota bacterium]|nr:PAN domain-containing protein [Nitrospirota bacterium]MDP2384533.1 PAN domain-containing protein [Nitrospirota bacterium]MDP3596251.1 PAN domain-containing protein [Nitrospirota bacterium]
MTAARNDHIRPAILSTHGPVPFPWAQHCTTGCTASRLVIILSLGLSACSMHEAPHPTLNADRSQTTIQLDKTVHFSAPDGAPVLATPNEYLVERTADEQLRLMPDKGGAPLIVTADRGTHDLEVSAPFPLVLAMNDDARNVVLLMPDGTALDASGSLSGMQTRDIVRPRRHYQLAYHVNPVTGQVQFGDGATGLRPPAASASLSPNYRAGAGSSGNPGVSPPGDSETSMIQLQSILSQRQVALAITTAITAAQSEHFRLEYDTNRPGGDYAQRTEISPASCRAVCAGDGSCQAFTFVKPPPGVTHGQCYLKRTVPAPVGDRCCISAKQKNAQQELIGNIGR